MHAGFKTACKYTSVLYYQYEHYNNYMIIFIVFYINNSIIYVMESSTCSVKPAEIIFKRFFCSIDGIIVIL